MAALEGGSHDADVANALKGVVHSADAIFIRHLYNDFLHTQPADLRMRRKHLAGMSAMACLCGMILYFMSYPWWSHAFIA